MDDIDKCIYECIYKCEKEIFRNRICIIMYFYCADTTKTNRENCKIKRKKTNGIDKEVLWIYYCSRYKVIHIKREI